MRKLYGLLTGLILLCCLQSALAQTKEVAGKVTDEKDGSPLTGVTVKVKNGNASTTTLADGTFKFNVPENATTLVFSYIGYAGVEQAISSLMNVTMASSDRTLNEVVVTGYTTIQRKKFSGASASVPISEVRVQPFGSFDQALQGNAAGVSVVANSGQPGANAIVRIRGNGSINGGNVPLYIMDGIEINAADFSSLNQGDFERVEILKDATATALYGSRGANGVIVITTRKGRAGQLNFNYDGQVGFSKLPEDRLVVMNSQQKIDYEIQRGNPFGWTQAEQDSLRLVNFNWTDALFRTGMTHQHMISASGGSATTRVFGSLSYMDQEGIVKTTGLKRYTARLNMDNTIKNWRFGINLQGGYSKIVGTGEANTFLSTPLNAIRWSNPYERDINPNTGDYQETGGAGTGQFTSGQPNGAMELFLNYNWNLQLKGVAISYIEFHFPFLEGLSARTNWGIDYVQNESSGFTSPRTSVGAARDGILTRAMNRNLRYTGTTSINFKRTFGKHEVDGGIFTEVVKNNSRNFGFTGFGFTNGFNNEAGITPGSVTNPNYIPTVAGGGSQSGLLSYFAIANYGYDSKYYITLVGRRDGSSRFGIENQFANFGSVGVTWVASDERFFQTVGWLNDLRLRASYGTNGNNNTAQGDFGQIPQFGRISYAGTNGWAPANPGNLKYRWETNKTLNFGIDFAVLGSRLSGTIDLYDRETKNLFYDQNPSLTTGFNAIPGNEGTLRNRGIELTLRGEVIRTRDFRWTIEGNITYNQNKVVSLPQDSVIAGLTILAIGKPLGSLYLVEYAGVNSANGNALYYQLDENKQRGDITQTYRASDRVIWGTSVAPLFGGISTSFSFKGFDLSAQLNFFLNRDVYNNDRVNVTNPTYYFDNMVIDVLKEWRQPGDVTDVPRPSSSGGNSFQSNTTRFMEDGSFWRLRNVTLSYTLTPELARKIGLKSARVFLQGQNYWTETKFRSFDPEITGASLVGAQYPALVQTTAGVSIGF
jgi:TonB-dependent starch-binding outer membrane protein SusC